MDKLDPGFVVPMTHVQCRLCGHDMPAGADTCLHCGQITRRVRVRQVLLVAVCVMLFVILAVAFAFSVSKSPVPPMTESLQLNSTTQSRI